MNKLLLLVVGGCLVVAADAAEVVAFDKAALANALCHHAHALAVVVAHQHPVERGMVNVHRKVDDV
jgi:hypothetical protein